MSPYSHLSSENILKLVQENLLMAEAGMAEGGLHDHARTFSNIALVQVLMVIVLELKKFNDRRELDMGCLPVLSDQEREEIKNKKVTKIDKDLGW